MRLGRELLASWWLHEWIPTLLRWHVFLHVVSLGNLFIGRLCELLICCWRLLDSRGRLFYPLWNLLARLGLSLPRTCIGLTLLSIVLGDWLSLLLDLSLDFFLLLTLELMLELGGIIWLPLFLGLWLTRDDGLILVEILLRLRGLFLGLTSRSPILLVLRLGIKVREGI